VDVLDARAHRQREQDGLAVAQPGTVGDGESRQLALAMVVAAPGEPGANVGIDPGPPATGRARQDVREVTSKVAGRKAAAESFNHPGARS
jgi:hypothetical protein